MKLKRFIMVLGLSSLIFMSGCGNYEEVNELRNIEALNSESSVTHNYNLSYADEQELIYAQVVDRQLLDLSVLDACSDSEIQQVVNYMNQVDEQLIGNIKVLSYRNQVDKYLLADYYDDEAVIDSSFTDYLLAFFERTPYYWQREKTTIRGIDAESRAIVVDVQYGTIDFEKEIKLDSTIVRGEPNYDKLVQIRFEKWMEILNMRTKNPYEPSLPSIEAEFVQHYGNPNTIIAEQRDLNPTTLIYETGNQITYSGLLDSEEEISGGTLNVRYVLVPNYVMGINLGITCKHMYITDYKLDKDCTETLTTFTKEGYATVTDSVYNLIYSYFTCIDEDNFEGLYKLTHDFKSMDKFYYDMFDTSYRKHEGFTISLFDITGTHVTCGVTIASKERAKGSGMTFPVYTDRYFVELELIDGVLKIDNMVLLSRKIEGEPAINTDDADILGFTAKIELNNDDRISIEKLICDFGALQLLGDTTSDDFSDVVDVSISTSQLSALKTNMMSLSGLRKVVWLQNYQQGTSNFASVKCKELYQDDSNAIVEATTIYDFILKGGKWYVYNYDVSSSVKLDTTNLKTTGSLCLVVPGKVEAYTSQVKSSVSTNLDDVSDTSVSFVHEPYTPTLKSGNFEQGLVKFTSADIDETVFDTLMPYVSVELDYSYSQFMNDLGRIRDIGDKNNLVEVLITCDDLEDAVFDSLAVLYNQQKGRYTDYEKVTIIPEQSEKLNTIIRAVGRLDSNTQEIDGTVLYTITEFAECLKNCLNQIGG